jgi:hypothetical protein
MRFFAAKWTKYQTSIHHFCCSNEQHCSFHARLHFLRLVPFTTFELESLADAILADSSSIHTQPDALKQTMEAQKVAASVLERESGTSSE